MQTNFEQTCSAYVQAVEAYLDTCFAWQNLPQQKLFDAMRYSLLAGGKRLRPLYVLEFCRLFVLQAALGLLDLAVELLDLGFQALHGVHAALFLLPAGLSLVHCIINPFLYVRFLLFFGLGFRGVRGAFPALIAFGAARRIVCTTFGAAVGEPLQVELEFVCHVYPS